MNTNYELRTVMSKVQTVMDILCRVLSEYHDLVNESLGIDINSEIMHHESVWIAFDVCQFLRYAESNDASSSNLPLLV